MKKHLIAALFAAALIVPNVLRGRSPGAVKMEAVLVNAIIRNDPIAARRALAAGANPDLMTVREDPSRHRAWDAYGWFDVNHEPLLAIAARNRDTRCLALLLECGARTDITDSYGWTPLMIAAGYGSTHAAAILLADGANPSAHSRDGLTPLWLAYINEGIPRGCHGITERYKIMCLLVYYGADVNMLVCEPQTVLQEVMMAPTSEENERIIKLLQSAHNANPEASYLTF